MDSVFPAEENFKTLDLPIRYVKPYRFPAKLAGLRHHQIPSDLAQCHCTHFRFKRAF
jgi:hypothetical protein